METQGVNNELKKKRKVSACTRSKLIEKTAHLLTLSFRPSFNPT